MGVGLVRSLQPPDILWIHWRVYNFIVNTSKRVLSDPFRCLCQKLSLSPLYFNKTLLHKSKKKEEMGRFLRWHPLVISFPCQEYVQTNEFCTRDCVDQWSHLQNASRDQANSIHIRPQVRGCLNIKHSIYLMGEKKLCRPKR